MFLIYYLNWIFHPWANSFIAYFGTFCSVQPSKKECLPCFPFFLCQRWIFKKLEYEMLYNLMGTLSQTQKWNIIDI